MSHIVLLGDSVFDNAVYCAPQPDVASHLRHIVGPRTAVSLLAVDGSITSEVSHQLSDVPDAATDLVISSGGNDALSHQGLLDLPVDRVARALSAFDEPLRRFGTDYRALLEQASRTGLQITVCTIYNGNLPPEIAVAASIAVALFNDIIQRAAHEVGAAVIELRAVCNSQEHYANPIEPSGSGGASIARAIAESLRVRAAR